SLCSSFFLHGYASLRHLHSFPTRRSSDLVISSVSTVSAVSAKPVPVPTPQAVAAEAAKPEPKLVAASAAPAEAKTPAVEVDPKVDRKSTRLNSSHVKISYAVFCLKKKKKE